MWKSASLMKVKAGLSLFSIVPGSFLISFPAWAQNLPNAPSAQKATVHKAQNSQTDWPRAMTSGTDTFLVYQPQVEKWQGNRVDLYSAVELKTGKDSAAKYGVIWFNARTEVDKINRLVTLDQVQLTKVTFPAAAEKEADLSALLAKKLPTVTKTISLDRLQAALEAAGEEIKGVDVKNDPPKVIIATKPSLLVLIDGPPQLREIEGTKLQRVINTRAVLLFENDKKNYYLRVQDWWLQAKDLEGPWTYAKKLPDDMRGPRSTWSTRRPGRPFQTEDQASKQPSLKEAGKKAEIPVVYVEFGPAELIETKGDPAYNAIPGTALEYVQNTNGNIFRLDTQYYILISGRWFSGASLQGPWTFVAGTNLPPDFAKIPLDNPKSTVLASVPGTPQAKEALIANSIPRRPASLAWKRSSPLNTTEKLRSYR